MSRTEGRPVPDVEEAVGLVDRLCDRSPTLDGKTWRSAGEFKSFFARFVKLQSGDGDQIVLKFGRGWDEADVTYVASEIERVRRLFADLPSGSVEVPPVLGFHSAPACIALPYVPGRNLFDLVAERASATPADRLDAMMTSSGEALGAYHAAESAPDEPSVRTTTRNDMRAAARRAGYRSGLVDRFEAGITVVRGYRLSHNDFTVHDEPGHGPRLVILDPPHVRKFDHVHRDLSAFTLALHRAWFGERAAKPSHGSYARFTALRSRFLDGYRRTSPVPLDTPLDDWLIAFYELSRIGSQLSGRIRSRQIGPTVRSVRWWGQTRRILGAPPI